MPTDSTLIWLTEDPALTRLSARLQASPGPSVPVSDLVYRAARIATDITVIESSLLTLAIVDATLPVLPGLSKIGALGAAALSAVALAAATIDIAVQLGELKVSLGILAAVPDSELKDIADRLETLSDPIGSLIDRAIEYLGKAGFEDADLAALAKEAKAFVDARAAAEKAVTPQDKLKHGLASIDAARKFIEKLGPTLKDRIRKERDKAERDYNDKALRNQKPQYDGVDYPNPPVPGSGPDFGDGGSQHA